MSEDSAKLLIAQITDDYYNYTGDWQASHGLYAELNLVIEKYYQKVVYVYADGVPRCLTA